MNYGGVREGYGVTWPQRHEFPVTFSLEICWPDGGRMVGHSEVIPKRRSGKPVGLGTTSRHRGDDTVSAKPGRSLTAAFQAV